MTPRAHYGFLPPPHSFLVSSWASSVIGHRVTLTIIAHDLAISWRIVNIILSLFPRSYHSLPLTLLQRFLLVVQYYI